MSQTHNNVPSTDVGLIRTAPFYMFVTTHIHLTHCQCKIMSVCKMPSLCDTVWHSLCKKWTRCYLRLWKDLSVWWQYVCLVELQTLSEESAIILGGCIRAVVFQGKSRVITMLVSWCAALLQQKSRKGQEWTDYLTLVSSPSIPFHYNSRYEIKHSLCCHTPTAAMTPYQCYDRWEEKSTTQDSQGPFTFKWELGWTISPKIAAETDGGEKVALSD